ncbi:MAG: carboxylating nicotinate-nucleotide diphosphorylase [Halieaceae bacterium]|nr:carboxylating nicotinate-nucleotide diphosphorylase [Halieaceae bacterium]
MTYHQPPSPSQDHIRHQVANALAEDIRGGDITAQLISEEAQANARIITREPGILCGADWAEQAFMQVDSRVQLEWHARDGDTLSANDTLFTVSGPARALLTAERTALNFLQLLSGTATRCHHYANLVEGTNVKLLDTRKTIPGLRLAQKYAVTCGGCHNHRIGLFDAFLIKENHIMACGGITEAVTAARAMNSEVLLEIEVESLAELQLALSAGADRIMLDNFDLQSMRDAVALTGGKAELEASGNVTDATLRPIAETGVDYISIGALTKDCKALDLSMRLLD